MATTVYDILEVTLQDDSTVTLKPAPIKVMRAFNAVLMAGPEINEDSDNQTSEDAGLDWIMKMVVLLLKKQRPNLTTDEAEDIIDLETAYKVIEVCGGVKLNDPKLVETAQAIAQKA